MGQAGVADYNVASWNALAAPARTPQAVIDRLNAAANEALKSPAVQDGCWRWACGRRAARRSSCSALLAAEIKHWREVIRAAKIEPE